LDATFAEGLYISVRAEHIAKLLGLAGVHNAIPTVNLMLMFDVSMGKKRCSHKNYKEFPHPLCISG
jgi:hypothetical protein